MKSETIRMLKRKGWSHEEMEKAQKIIDKRITHDKSRSMSLSNKVVFWSVVFVIILGNFIISMLLIPFLIILEKLALDIFVIILGFAFGTLFNLVLTDIRYVDRKYHLIAGVAIPVLAVFNLSLMTQAANALNNVLGLTAGRANPVTISILYTIAFITPYLWSLLVTKKVDFAYKRTHRDRETQKQFLKKY